MSATAHQSPSEKVRLYFKVFFALFVITILEVGATFLPGHKIVRDVIICLLASMKAGMVGYYYMHLNHETKWLRIVALLPIFMFVYAAVLMPDAEHHRQASEYLPVHPRVFPVSEHESEEAEHAEAQAEHAEEAKSEFKEAGAAAGEGSAAKAEAHEAAPPAGAPAAAPAAPAPTAPAAGGNAADEWR
ncbi:MAG: cytochrome C oxidase subunit IV family protein [Bdellovibrionales bacterium]|nr:cytochrome C oxidase subunit IV family protein [Bdellovibrionales bacterium]